MSGLQRSNIDWELRLTVGRETNDDLLQAQTSPDFWVLAGGRQMFISSAKEPLN